MHPIQRFVDPGNSNEYFVDLRRIVMFTRHSSSDSSTIHMDPAEHDLCLHDNVADRINEAWRAYNAPRPDVAGPGLPAGWTDGGDGGKCKDGETLYTAYGPSGCYARLEIWPDGVATWSQFRAPPAVYLHLLRAAGVAS